MKMTLSKYQTFKRHLFVPYLEFRNVLFALVKSIIFETMDRMRSQGIVVVPRACKYDISMHLHNAMLAFVYMLKLSSSQ